MIDIKRIKSNLGDFWKDIILLEEVSSTNDVLRGLVEEAEEKKGVKEGLVVIAACQTQGRGRHGRGWISPRGGAWFSILLRPDMKPEEGGRLSILIGVAVAESLKRWLDLPIGVKWPNDLVLNQRKLGGILIESKVEDRMRWAIAGVGVNVNNSPDLNTAISLKEEIKREIPLEDFFAVVLGGIEREYKTLKEEGFDPIRKKWQELSKLQDQVKIHYKGRVFQAHVLGLSSRGELIVRTDDRIEFIGDATVKG
jgi:BirA family biotin operon repressor/biotin-[acetyl-CoA-carboxylase] ligase